MYEGQIVTDNIDTNQFTRDLIILNEDYNQTCMLKN